LTSQLTPTPLVADCVVPRAMSPPSEVVWTSSGVTLNCVVPDMFEYVFTNAAELVPPPPPPPPGFFADAAGTIDTLRIPNRDTTNATLRR
jgi:hypothetical protein